MTSNKLNCIALSSLLLVAFQWTVATAYDPVQVDKVVDLSPTISRKHLQNWPGGQLHHPPIVVSYIQHGPGPLAADLLLIDENTATQTDCPPHMMAPQDSGLPNAHYYGDLTCDRVPAWGWTGEVFKIDGRDILDRADDGASPLFTVEKVKVAEEQHRPLRPGDAVLYWSGYDDQTEAALREFEAQYGDLPTADMTSDKIPVHYLVGPARVINVQHRVGTTDAEMWPSSPAITADDIKAYEKTHGSIRQGEIVLFNTGHTSTHFRTFERGSPEMCMREPLAGRSEGWPAPTPEAIFYLAEKGVRHVGIDTPDMGSVDAVEAAHTHWAAVKEGMIFSEFLIGVGQLPPTGAFYIFLNPKIENNHGGPGRAIAILP